MLRSSIRSPTSRGLIVIGATRSDAHVVSIYSLSMMLEELGYEVINLSCCNATAEFFEAIPPGRKVTAIVVANQNGSALADLQELPGLLHARPVPVILGGHYYVGCDARDDIDHQLYQIGVSCIATTPEAMFAFLDDLESGTGPIVAPQPARQSELVAIDHSHLLGIGV